MDLRETFRNIFSRIRKVSPNRLVLTTVSHEKPKMAAFPEYKREFKYTNQMEQNTAYMLLGHPLGFDDKSKSPYIIGAIFAEEMYFWASVGKEVCVKINCPGGGIMDGFSIMDAIRTTDASTVNVGVAASMAVSIMLSARKEKRSAMAYAKMMIHPPAGKDKIAVDAMRGSLTQILTDTSNFSAVQITDMLKDGAPDTWLTAKEMAQNGLILKKNILSTNAQPEEVEETDPYALYNIFNQFNENMAETPKPVPGTDVTQAFLDIHNQLAASKAETAAKDAAILEMTNKLKALEDQAKADKLSGATALVDVAIKNKQLTMPVDPTEALVMRNQYVEMAATAPVAFKAMLAPVKVAPATERTSVLNHINVEGQNGVTTPKEETYEYLANHNPKKLYAMMDENPEQYAQIVNQFQQTKNRII